MSVYVVRRRGAKAVGAARSDGNGWWGGACGQATRGEVRLCLVGKGRDHQGGNAEAGGWSGVVPLPSAGEAKAGPEASWTEVGVWLSVPKEKTGRT